MTEDKVSEKIKAHRKNEKKTKSDFSCQSSCGGNGEVIHNPNEMVII